RLMHRFFTPSSASASLGRLSGSLSLQSFSSANRLMNLATAAESLLCALIPLTPVRVLTSERAVATISSRSNRSSAGGQIQTAHQKTNLEVLAARVAGKSRAGAVLSSHALPKQRFLGRRVLHNIS